MSTWFQSLRAIRDVKFCAMYGWILRVILEFSAADIVYKDTE